MNKNNMSVADFFCGAGGFSEGFRQAGFKVVFALDKWQPAVDTHRENHPKCKTFHGDILKIAYLEDKEFDELVPDTDIIIGSPPCVAFSNSNKSGKGDKSLGIKLFLAYLRIIARKKYKDNSKLKYWVLENVPNLKKYIKESYSANELGLEGEFELRVLHESSCVYNAKYYNVPSNRRRFMCGNFPKLKSNIVDGEIQTLGDVLNALNPPKQKLDSNIKDPNYNFKMKSLDITDHHYICEIAKHEWSKAKRHKQDKGYMGKMSFPENTSRPARTVMATMSASSRESMIFQYEGENHRYRYPTVREVATIMSFPIDYKFYGKSKSIKYKLVGNAVPPKLSYHIAKLIAEREGMSIPKTYRPIKHANKIEFINLNFNEFELKKEKRKNKSSRFKYHIPYLIINAFRVELTNYTSSFLENKYKWEIEIHKSQGKNRKVYCPIISDKVFRSYSEEIEKFKHKFKGLTYSSLQMNHCLTDEERIGLIGPMELLKHMRQFVDSLEISDTEFSNIDGIKYPTKILIGYYILRNIVDGMK